MKLSSEILKVVLVSSLILILSCGKKSTGRSPGWSGYNIPQNVAYNIQRYLDTFACSNGRINPITFSASQYYTGTGNTTQIQGNFQANPIGGNASNSYVGVNSGTRDVISITKMTDGSRVLGFNITLYLCRSVTSLGGYTFPVIDQSRLPTVAGTDRPIIVSDPTNCSIGTVDQAIIYVNIPAYRVPNSNSVLQAQQFPIAFTRGNCL